MSTNDLIELEKEIEKLSNELLGKKYLNAEEALRLHTLGTAKGQYQAYRHIYSQLNNDEDKAKLDKESEVKINFVNSVNNL